MSGWLNILAKVIRLCTYTFVSLNTIVHIVGDIFVIVSPEYELIVSAACRIWKATTMRNIMARLLAAECRIWKATTMRKFDGKVASVRQMGWRMVKWHE